METTPTPEEKVTEEGSGRFSKFLSSLGIEERGAKVLIVTVIFIVLFSAYISFRLMAPFGFPENKMITVKKGASLTEVSALLDKENLIRSQSLFEFCAKVVGGTKPVSAGQYLFKEPISACTIAIRIARSISGIPAIKVTIPEGMSNKEVSEVLEKNIPGFDTAFFLEHARSQEGFLFPDTYLFPENTTAQGVETMMIANFNKKIEPWTGAIEASKHSLRDIVNMASILEREASTPEDMSLVSGVLWNRISKGMPLQVDATFMYLLGRKSSELTTADLKIKSAYNTYVNKGLPGGPIGNPGITAISAAINPTATSFMYYLSDKDGMMHYAKTFDEHVANKNKYLR
ncbi:MAG: YceG family protein [Parcubacteria group bacterium GW2011_GWA1_44_13]|uniref:Endolytic murein transglycosylase n=1 Tax=Candidatus Nomurabacteria bacterium GW2011_GWB1_44_12 TaxID=1618748 RepID=A0A837ICT8_9BACT|nr:MAG: YceG family protein [Candidatus Nomurabacteria bacterium GW2011_GWB1_44_12]KKT38076.1 MAG: YceG family protein [Parcubacteria group bacterium GW2011_GWA1_44_13]KKT59760.1 MAG: YceG family protein [Parcubacteria group bacterium GW2011_GWC1_44_26]HBB44347.1 endolytic transglycosylase MltG [Candidatus Yonathbacteria bacterium]